MFSSTTIASSQTRPIDSTMATSVSTLIVKPARYMTKKPEMMLTGIAITGMMVERQSRRNEEDDQRHQAEGDDQGLLHLRDRAADEAW